MNKIKNISSNKNIPEIFSLENEDGTLKIADIGGYQKYLFLLLNNFHLSDISYRYTRYGTCIRGHFLQELIFDKYADYNGNISLGDKDYIRLVSKLGKTVDIFNKFEVLNIRIKNASLLWSRSNKTRIFKKSNKENHR